MRLRWRRLGALLTALGAALPAFAAAAEGKALRVCLLADNLPYAARADERGFDVDTARAVADHLRRPFEAVWTDNDPRIQEIDDSDFPVRKLARSECDAIFSMPGPASDTLTGTTGVALGEPYYGAAFELVGCAQEVPPQFRALRGMKVAIQSQTVAHFALLMVKSEPVTYFSVAAALAGIGTHAADAGLLWGPTAGWHMLSAGADGRGCEFVPGYEPPAAVRWNLHVATRSADEPLRIEIDTALVVLTASGRIAAIGKQYGMPVRGPFSGTYSLGALNDLQRAQ